MYKVEATALTARLDRAQSQGGQALKDAEQEIVSLQSQLKTIESQLKDTKQDRDFKIEKIVTLENSLANVALGHEEQIARDQAAAIERENQQRERDLRHKGEIMQCESKYNDMETKYNLHNF